MSDLNLTPPQEEDDQQNYPEDKQNQEEEADDHATCTDAIYNNQVEVEFTTAPNSIDMQFTTAPNFTVNYTE